MNHETKVNMAAINNKKTKSTECSYLMDHQLVFYYSVLEEHFEGITKKTFGLKCCTDFITPTK